MIDPNVSDDDAPLLRVFSMNCWGLKYIAKHREARLEEISRRIASFSPAYDIVCLQEFWVQSDYQTLRRHTSSIYPYGKFYFSGAIGGGLVILSRFPIVSSSMHRYPLNGRPTAFFRGDFYVGKGVACATIQHPSGRRIEVFNTHLHAPYEERDTYLCHRTAQAWEIAKLIKGAVERGSVVVAAGDFNMIPSSLAHRIISTHGGVSDSWLSAYPETPAVQPLGATAKYNIEVLGATCDSVLNTWRMPGPQLPPSDSPDPRAKRLDYVFHSPQTSSVQSVKVGMTEPMPMPSQTGGKGGAAGVCTLSDHFSVEVTLRLTSSRAQDRAQTRVRSHSIDHQSLVDYTGEARAQEAEVVDQVGTVPRESHLPLTVLSDIQSVTDLYFAKEESEYFWRLLHFWLSIPVLIACHVAVWWSPHNGVAFMLVFVGWIVAVTGVLDGLIGFMFTGAELNALREFRMEVEMYRGLVEGKVGVGAGRGSEGQ